MGGQILDERWFTTSRRKPREKHTEFATVGQSGAGRSHRGRRAAHRDGREHEPDGGAAQSLRYRYQRACCGPKALPLGLRDREVAAPSLSYREPPSTRSVVVYIGGVATRSKKRAQASIEIAPGGDWHIVPLAGLCGASQRLL